MFCWVPCWESFFCVCGFVSRDFLNLALIKVDATRNLTYKYLHLKRVCIPQITHITLVFPITSNQGFGGDLILLQILDLISTAKTLYPCTIQAIVTLTDTMLK